jgi:hypothetical protein
LGLRQHRAFLVSGVALFAASAAACSTVLGLDPPTLDPCANGCPDASISVADASGSSSGGDSGSAIDAVSESAAADVIGDVIPDVIPDRGPSNGLRCGSGASAIFCAAPTDLCCLTFDDAGSPSYACVSDTTACTPGYPIACASDNDCAGSDVCCFYNSGIKCEPENTPSCAAALVCDPGAPASDEECNTGQTCDVAYLLNGFPLPYDGCN